MGIDDRSSQFEKETKLSLEVVEEEKVTMKGIMKILINLKLNVILAISLAIILGSFQLKM